MPNRTCSVPGCTSEGRIIIEWCERHYWRWKKYGEPTAGRPFLVRNPPQCVVDGCDVKAKGKGMCSSHLNRFRRYGDPLVQRATAAELVPCCEHGCMPTAEGRFWAKVSGGSYCECWLWTRGVNAKGYGRFSPADRGWRVLAHRWAYEHMIGPIPGGLELDHLCRVRRCVNPWHLDPVTHEENVRRANAA